MNDVVVITGIRELHPNSRHLVAERVQAVCGETSVMVFGGALGVDTEALIAAGEYNPHGPPQRVVVVPFTLKHQPNEAQKAIRYFAHVVRELGLPQGRSAYLQRNDVMLERAAAVNQARKNDQHSLLLAFTDGRKTGGTAYTIKEAKKLGIRTVIVTVGGTGREP